MGFESPKVNSEAEPLSAEEFDSVFNQIGQQTGTEIQALKEVEVVERKSRLERLKTRINAIADVADQILDRSIGLLTKPLFKTAFQAIRTGSESFRVAASSTIDALAEATKKEGRAGVDLVAESIPKLTYGTGKGTTRFLKGIIDGIK